MAQPRFKPVMQNQPMLFPPDISDLIPQEALVRVVDRIVDGMDRSRLERLYPGGGSSAYDPSMMLKVILYCYSSGIYSSRRIERATRENINLMWLCGMHPIDHNTINRFRSDRIRPVFEEIFTEVVAVLLEAGYITLDTYFLDGTKIEANANKFSFVWGKSTKRQQELLRAKVHAHLAAIDEMEDEEEALAPPEPAQVDAERLREAAKRINDRLAKKEQEAKEKQENEQEKRTRKQMRKLSREIERDFLPRMERYEENLEILQGRNSFSKTDHDATFMRMKDDHMGNGQLKAAYNIQLGTENQFIVCTTLHQRPNDTACTIEHCEHLKEVFGTIPAAFVADAGYGSEATYAYLEEEGVTAYVKHAEFFRECRNRKWREDEMRPANWVFDEAEDAYTCPEGRRLTFKGKSVSVNERGYTSTSRLYECEGCEGCSRRRRCTKSTDPGFKKCIRINPRLDALKEKASMLLHTPEGSELRKRRGIDVETVFGDIKRNLGFTRFTLRGLEKTRLEWRLIAAGHNIRKLHLAELGKAREIKTGMAPA